MSHHYFHHHKPTHNPHHHPPVLDVVAVVSNTQRYESRYRLFKKFYEEMMANPHVRLTVVEMAFGHRPHFVSDPNNNRHIHLRSDHDLWIKECLINVGISRLPHDWKYVAWVDADVSFCHKDWAHETVEALQHYQIVQPWESCVDLGPYGSATATHTSFGKYWVDGKITDTWPPTQYYGTPKPFPHTGYAWAARRDAINMMGNYFDGGLLTTAILGAADHHMAASLVGLGKFTVPSKVHSNYLRAVLDWEKNAQALKRNVGVVPGTILHEWHGKKVDRKYGSRWKILEKYQFDPEVDVNKDWQNLWQLNVTNARQRGLRDALRKYMKSRNEDSVDSV